MSDHLRSLYPRGKPVYSAISQNSHKFCGNDRERRMNPFTRTDQSDCAEWGFRTPSWRTHSQHCNVSRLATYLCSLVGLTACPVYSERHSSQTDQQVRCFSRRFTKPW
ncbi:hypothetical protein BX600DRAFT_58424 [Xylariales sp. PMI_506]|nr:hypothetical protein BX600DRAFT_58424 [Xylariales sp. PMI_506]